MVTRLMIRKILSELGDEWEIQEAESADKAATLLPNLEHLDLITVDQNMPGTLSGLDFIEKYQASVPNAKIALITANVQDQIRKRAQGLNIIFIEKPITAEKIKQHV